MPLMVALWALVIILVIVVLAIFLLFGLLVTIGTPRRAKEIEASLVHVALIDRYGFGPILVSNRGICHTDITSLTFLSRGISKEAWEKKRKDIEDRLNVHYVEEIKYGGKNGSNRNYIILTVAPGINEGRAELLYDDEL